MNAPRMALALLLCGFVLGGCANESAITGPDQAPVRPMLDAGGFGMGSGGKAAPDSTTTQGTTATEDTASPPKEERGGGFGMGSGG